MNQFVVWFDRISSWLTLAIISVILLVSAFLIAIAPAEAGAYHAPQHDTRQMDFQADGFNRIKADRTPNHAGEVVTDEPGDFLSDNAETAAKAKLDTLKSNVGDAIRDPKAAIDDVADRVQTTIETTRDRS